MYTKEDYFQSIGHISVLFATWDFMVTMILAAFNIDLKERDTLGIKLKKLRELSISSCIPSANKILSGISVDIDKAWKVSDERNRYIHDLWEFSEKITKGKINRIRMVLGTDGVHIKENVELTWNDLENMKNLVLKQQSIFWNHFNNLKQIREDLPNPSIFGPQQ